MPAPTQRPSLATIAGPLENAFSTIPGIDSMTSSSVQGSVTITIQFALDRNIDAAGTDVQAAISSALSKLPKTMVSPPTFQKVNPTDDPVLFLVMSSKTLPLTIVDEYADTLLARQLSQVSGVAQVNVFGAAQYAVRIQADPAALVARGIGIDTAGRRHTEQQRGPGDGRDQWPDRCPDHSDPAGSWKMRQASETRSSPTAMARRCASAMSPM